MELDNKTIKSILGKLERYAFTLSKVLESKEGNFATRQAIKLELNSCNKIIDKLKNG